MTYVFKLTHSADLTAIFNEAELVVNILMKERKRLLEEDEGGRRPFPHFKLFNGIKLNYMLIRGLSRRCFNQWDMSIPTLNYLSYRDNTGRYLRIDDGHILVLTPFNLRIDLTNTDLLEVYEEYPDLHLLGAEVGKDYVRVSCIININKEADTALESDNA